jgi:hypothetical protein
VPRSGLAEHVGADQGALAQITQKLATAGDLTVAFARRRQELANAIAAGRDWLGIDHDSLPDRRPFMRALPHQGLWLPPIAHVVHPTTERKLSQSAPSAQGLVGKKAAVTFGNLADIGKALRATRKARREELEHQADVFQPPMFDFWPSDRLERRRTCCDNSAPGYLPVFPHRRLHATSYTRGPWCHHTKLAMARRRCHVCSCAVRYRRMGA